MAKEKVLPTRVRVVKAFLGASDHVHTRHYDIGEVHEVGGKHMSEELTRSLLSDDHPAIEAVPVRTEVSEVEEAVDDTLDVSSGRHRVSALPPALRIKHEVDAYASTHEHGEHAQPGKMKKE